VFVRENDRPNVLSAGGRASIIKAGPLLRNARIAAAADNFIAQAAKGLGENERSRDKRRRLRFQLESLTARNMVRTGQVL
jgi:hypothetical protein